MSYYTNPKSSTYSSYYRLIDNKGAIRSHMSVMCFSSITYGIMEDTIVTVQLPVPKKVTGYSEESIIRWVAFLNDLGFPMEYKGLINDEYIVNLPMYDEAGNKNYEQRLRFNTALTAFRYLYHSGLDCVPDKFFNLKICFQMKIRLCYSLQHKALWVVLPIMPLIASSAVKLYDVNVWKEKLEDNKTSLYKAGRVSLNNTWGHPKYDAYMMYNPDNSLWKQSQEWSKDLKTRFEQLKQQRL